jgi:hypothetical protein
MKLDAQKMDFFHSFSLKIIDSAELFNFCIDLSERVSGLVFFFDVVEVVY